MSEIVPESAFPLPGSGRAVVAVPAPGAGPGYWAGAPSVALDEDGSFVIAYRVRKGHDGNDATDEQPGWRPLLATPNHPEYPAAHGSITSAVAEVVSQFLGTNRIEVDIHGFDPAGVAGNLDASRHFERDGDLRQEIVDARVWAGVHYRFSGVAGVALGRSVAKYDLRQAFRPIG